MIIDWRRIRKMLGEQMKKLLWFFKGRNHIKFLTDWNVYLFIFSTVHTGRTLWIHKQRKHRSHVTQAAGRRSPGGAKRRDLHSCVRAATLAVKSFRRVISINIMRLESIQRPRDVCGFGAAIAHLWHCVPFESKCATLRLALEVPLSEKTTEERVKLQVPRWKTTEQ